MEAAVRTSLSLHSQIFFFFLKQEALETEEEWQRAEQEEIRPRRVPRGVSQEPQSIQDFEVIMNELKPCNSDRLKILAV